MRGRIAAKPSRIPRRYPPHTRADVPELDGEIGLITQPSVNSERLGRTYAVSRSMMNVRQARHPINVREYNRT